MAKINHKRLDKDDIGGLRFRLRKGVAKRKLFGTFKGIDDLTRIQPGLNFNFIPDPDTNGFDKLGGDSDADTVADFHDFLCHKFVFS